MLTHTRSDRPACLPTTTSLLDVRRPRGATAAARQSGAQPGTDDQRPLDTTRRPVPWHAYSAIQICLLLLLLLLQQVIGSLNRVPASAGVKVGMSLLPGSR